VGALEAEVDDTVGAYAAAVVVVVVAAAAVFAAAANVDCRHHIHSLHKGPMSEQPDQVTQDLPEEAAQEAEEQSIDRCIRRKYQRLVVAASSRQEGQLL
jgi:Spy/CpxP family protein refolding chaperone